MNWTPAAALCRPRSHEAGGYSFALGCSPDDEDIRRLLRETRFPGPVSLSLEREPDSFAALSVEGDVHQMIVARDRTTGRIAAIASRSERDVFINGERDRLGYLGQLRIAPDPRRHRRLLDAGFAFCRCLHEQGSARIYLASVVADNRAALRLLARRSETWPRFEPVDRLVTFAIPVRALVVPHSWHREHLWQGHKADVRVERGSSVALGTVADCLNRNAPRYQFAPYWTTADLRSSERTRGLDQDDFIVALRSGRVVGCLAVWDQRSFKQAVVRGYSGTLRRLRPFINVCAPWLGIPTLPPPGTRLEFACISHLAIDADEVEVFTALLRGAAHLAGQKSLDYVAIGLSGSNPLLPFVRRHFRHRSYESVLHAVFWPDGEPCVRALDRRPFHPELALL